MELLLKKREALNIGKRTLKGSVKAFFLDLKIRLLSFWRNETHSYERRDAYTIQKEKKEIQKINNLLKKKD